MRIEVISPHGFCGGVERAVRIAQETLAGASPVFCLHEIVHNRDVVRGLEAEGMRFAETLDEVPDGATLLVSAHGTSPAVLAAAASRRLHVVDATCPFVAAAHAKIRENFAKGMRTAIIGEPSHAEVLGYLGEPGACLPEDVKPGEAVDVVEQTTLDAGAHGGACTATRDRQRAVRTFADAHGGASAGVLVVGGENSANTLRLAGIARDAGLKAWRVSSADELAGIDFGGIGTLGVTSGASTPESVFRSVVEALGHAADGALTNGGGD